MDFNKEIKKHKQEIERLEELRQEQIINSYPNIIGKYYKFNEYFFIMVTSISDDYTDEENYRYLYVKCVSIRSDKDFKNVCIDTNDEVKLDLNNKEVNAKEFNDFFEKMILLFGAHIY